MNSISRIKLLSRAALLLFFIRTASCQNCFQTQSLTATLESQVLVSPKYPNNYDNNLDCFVTINNPSGQLISIRSLAMSIESSAACTYDYLSINGVKYCGTTPIDVTLPSTRTVQIQFHTDVGETYPGFVLQYALVPDVCSGSRNLTASSVPKLLSSPNYPSSYNNNLSCSLTINSTLGQPIKLQSFAMNTEGQTTSCYDYLSINQVKYCGNRTIDVVNTAPVQIIFHTDASNTFSGFLLQYSLQAVACFQTQSITATLESQVLLSPKYPNNYDNNLNCVVTINNPPGQLISIRSQFMSLESSSSCAYDYLSINGVKYCGTTAIDVIVPTARQIQITFHTDSGVTSTGFSLQYALVQDVCSGPKFVTASSAPKLLSSPNYPSSYNNNLNCSLTISSVFGQAIQIHSLAMNTETQTNCGYDYLSINQVKYCGSRTIDVVNTSPVQIIFHTDTSNTFSGFLLQYGLEGFVPAPTCSVLRLTAESTAKYLQSSDVSSSLSGSLLCYQWRISTRYGFGQVYLNLNSFDVGSASSCSTSSSSVAIYDGPFITSQQKVVLCGHIYSRYDTSNSTSMTLVYKTSNPTRDYFSFSYSSVNDYNPSTATCYKQYLTAESYNKYLSSSDVSTSPTGYQCYEWHISTQHSSGEVSLQVSTFSVGSQSSSLCSTSSIPYVAIYDGSTSTSSQMDVLCGYKYSGYYTSTFSSMTIVYRTSNPSNDAFSFTYSSIGDYSYSYSYHDYNLSSGAISGIIIGSIFSFLVVTFVLIVIVRWQRQKQITANNRGTIYTIPTREAMSPATVNNGPTSNWQMSPQNFSSAPPPYSSLQTGTTLLMNNQSPFVASAPRASIYGGGAPTLYSNLTQGQVTYTGLNAEKSNGAQGTAIGTGGNQTHTSYTNTVAIEGIKAQE